MSVPEAPVQRCARCSRASGDAGSTPPGTPCIACQTPIARAPDSSRNVFTSGPSPPGIFFSSVPKPCSFWKKMLPPVAFCQPASMIRNPSGKPDARIARAADTRLAVVCSS